MTVPIPLSGTLPDDFRPAEDLEIGEAAKYLTINERDSKSLDQRVCESNLLKHRSKYLLSKLQVFCFTGR
jgi:hypothetical protein